MTQKTLSEQSGVSVATLRKLQKAEPADRGKPLLMALSVTLGWAPTHLQALSEGESVPADPTDELREQVEAIRADLDDVRDRLTRVEAANRSEM
jgi:hypothetical protein